MSEYGPPHIAVLLCTYHGEQYLREQLDSIVGQDYKNFSLWISDDSEHGQTRKILEEYQAKWPNVIADIRTGPKKGCSENFLSLLMDTDISADYYALSDQDDIWLNNKLSRAVDALERRNKHNPLLYCSRVKLVDENSEARGFSPLFSKPPSFSNALVQSIAGGNTMVLNRAARKAVVEAQIHDVVVHDWWLYLLVTAVGGEVVYDEEPTLLYRQHGSNEIGCDQSFFARMSRVKKLFKGQHKAWHEKNLQALKSCSARFTDENTEILNQFILCHRGNFYARTKMLFNMPVKRQTFYGQLTLYMALLAGKL